MEDNTLDMLQDLTELDGVPGFEDQVREFIRERLEGVVEFEMDNLGSIICKKAGEADSPRLMIPAHMDEIGFMVKDITDEGFLRFAPLGGWLDQTLLGHVVTVHTRTGAVRGVIGSKPPHLMPAEERKKIIKRKTMFIDVGARDKEHAQDEMGVRIGDPVVPRQSFERIGDGEFLLAKAWDDRVGCAIMIDVLRRLADTSHPNTVFGVGTTQEEVGTRGAETAVDVVNPDFCIVLDVGLATDMPGIEGKAKTSMGEGPIIYMMDAGAISDRRFNEMVISLAEERDIPYQLSLMEGGATDARVIHVHSRGVPSVSVGIPARYIHSHAGLIHADDYDATVQLVLETAKSLSTERAEEMMGR